MSLSVLSAGRNDNVCLETVMVLNGNTFPVYFTILPDLSVRSRTPAVFTKTMSKTSLHCSHLLTAFGHVLLSSR